jgi:hypothetical protein
MPHINRGAPRVDLSQYTLLRVLAEVERPIVDFPDTGSLRSSNAAAVDGSRLSATL